MTTGADEAMCDCGHPVDDHAGESGLCLASGCHCREPVPPWPSPFKNPTIEGSGLPSHGVADEAVTSGPGPLISFGLYYDGGREKWVIERTLRTDVGWFKDLDEAVIAVERFREAAHRQPDPETTELRPVCFVPTDGTRGYLSTPADGDCQIDWHFHLLRVPEGPSLTEASR